jgi:C1A family cysteine protease
VAIDDATRGHDCKVALAGGFPVIFGFSVYDSFESDDVATTGIVPMPDYNNEQCVGGHAVLMMGYSDITKRYLVRNSWGSWGMGGFFTIPYTYINDPQQANDFWVVHNVAGF